MNAILHVATYHFRREVLKRSYLLTLLSLPLFVAFMIGMIRITASLEDETVHLGVVDPGGFIQELEVPGRDDDVEIIFFKDETAALAALNNGDNPINGFYLLPDDYPENRSVDLVVQESLDFSAQGYFADLLRTNILLVEAPKLAERVVAGSSILVRAIAANREFPASDPTVGLFIPLILAIIYVFTIFPIAGIMAGALGDEKANRTIEVVVTSISTRQLMSGKILAVTAMALLQVTTWVLFLVVAIWIGAEGFDLPWLQGLTVSWRDAGVIAVLAVPGFLFYGAVLVLIGSLIDDAETLQQMAGLVSFPLFLPLYVLPFLISEPEGTISMLFLILPITSVLTAGIQSIFREIPTLWIALSFGVSLASAIGLIWLASRAFRVGMLRYGKRIRLRELFDRKGAGSRA